MRTLRKYEFANEAALDAAIVALGVDEEGNPTHSHAIMKIGHIVETPAVLDEDGEVVTEAVLSSTYAVDVIWQGEPVEAWDAQMIWCPPMGVLVSGGIETRMEWIDKCKELHPEYFPTPPDDELV
jgi:hypothetical protein